MHLKDQFMQNDFCVVARVEISLPRKLKRANVWYGRNSRGGERGQMELPPSLPPSQRARTSAICITIGVERASPSGREIATKGGCARAHPLDGRGYSDVPSIRRLSSRNTLEDVYVILLTARAHLQNG